MPARSKYRTKQREVLLEYLKTVPGTHVTAADACAWFENKGTPIGQSTVYRQLERLVDEGLVNKYVTGIGTPACFEYVGEGSHAQAEVCFHCKCEKCGRLIHLHCDELMEIEEHLLREHRFRMDPLRTVFYGLCEDCMQ